MLKDSFAGAAYFLRGITLITKPGIRAFVIIPFLLNMLIFGLLIAYGYQQFGELLDWLLPEEGSWWSWLNWLRWVVLPIFFTVAAVIMFFTFSILANLIGAPFNSLLAEAVERHMTGQTNESKTDLKQFMASIVPSMISELKKMGYYIVISLPFIVLFLIAFFIPLLNLVASLAWLLVTAWILAVQYCDYPFDNHTLNFVTLRQRLGQRRFMAFGFGGSAMFLMAIPVINFIVMPTAVAGATAMSLEKFRLDEKPAE